MSKCQGCRRAEQRYGKGNVCWQCATSSTPVVKPVPVAEQARKLTTAELLTGIRGMLADGAKLVDIAALSERLQFSPAEVMDTIDPLLGVVLTGAAYERNLTPAQRVVYAVQTCHPDDRIGYVAFRDA